MDDVTQRLQKLAKSRSITKLIYGQTNTKTSSVFVDD
jgi:hypothetical protein